MAKTAYEMKKNANARYRGKQDQLCLLTPQGTKQAVQAHAAARGESMAAFVLRAIQEQMKRDTGNFG